MDLRHQAELAELLADREPPFLSLYQPTHRAYPENQQDPIRFRNLVKELETSLRRKYSAVENGPVKTLALKQWGGGPVDYQWQVPSAEFWLKKHGLSDLTPSRELQPKPQPAPRGNPLGRRECLES